jgi:hypothetical protein
MRNNKFTTGCAHTDHLNSGNPAEIETPECPLCSSPVEGECASCEAQEKGEISLDLLEEIELQGIDLRDAPDYVDASIKSAAWVHYPKGSDPKLTEEQLDRVPQEAVYELLQKRLH